MEKEKELLESSMKPAPFRRLLARSLDYFAYEIIWGAVLVLVMDVSMLNRSGAGDLLDYVMAGLLMLLLEPALLRLFGTTLGKWILGIKVLDKNDKRLSYGEGVSRTWKVICRGVGLGIPIYNLVRLWKSYRACKDGETLNWDEGCKVVIRDKKGVRILAYVGVYVIFGGLLFLFFYVEEMPKHRGDISAKEFCDNYNRYAKHDGVNDRIQIDADGEMLEVDISYERAAASVIVGESIKEPEYTYKQENGSMRELEFTLDVTNGDIIPSSRNEMVYSILAFVRAQKGCGLFLEDVNDMVEQIQNAPFESFEFTSHGVTVICKITYSGYSEYDEVLLPEEGEKQAYSLTFTMKKE